MIFTEEQKLFRQTVREFAQTEVRAVARQIQETGVVPKEIYRRCGELGLIGVNAPTELGGSGLGLVETSIVFEEIARESPALALCFEITIVTWPTIRQSKTITEKYLPGLLAGERAAGSGCTPPEGLPNGAEWSNSMKKVDGGYIFNGRRLYATNSDSDLVYAWGVDEEGVVHVCFFEREWEGVSSLPLDRKLGMTGNSGGTLVFENVFVPDENVTFSAEGNTLYVCYVGCSAEALGCAKGLFEKTVEFCKNRTHGNKPLTDMTAVHYKLGELKTKLLMCEAMVYDTAAIMDELDRMEEPDPELELQWQMQSSACKVQVSEMLVDVCLECVKLHGGIGYHDPMVWHYLGDAQNYCHMDITNEIHYSYVAAQMGLVG